MNDFILFLAMLNLFASLIVYFIILRDNDNDFIEWVKYSFGERNWFGRLQICLAIMWMLPVIIISLIVYPIAWIGACIICGIILVFQKIVELGKR